MLGVHDLGDVLKAEVLCEDAEDVSEAPVETFWRERAMDEPRVDDYLLSFGVDIERPQALADQPEQTILVELGHPSLILQEEKLCT